MARLLMVEDNEGDADLVREVLVSSEIPLDLAVVKDGEEALAYLRREGPYRDAPRPDVILLDLNLPRLDGREVLRLIKQDADLKRIPVVVLSSSGAERDIAQSYALNANAFVTKPADFDQFAAAIRSLESFWLATARLPAEAS
ncbi:MAG: response regulator [Candidatus Sericytochromatia bacterium]|nr:response regulator [Candidatus Tanganyikabacteria bacterium]